MTVTLDTGIRMALFQEFVATGRCPSAARLSCLVDLPLQEVRASLERLAAAKAIVLQPESREVLFAPPLSTVPTPFAVEANDRLYFAPCIWDALGIPAMLNTPAAIRTSCACCGEAVQLSVEAGADVDPSLPALIHFGVPAKHWWDHIAFT